MSHSANTVADHRLHPTKELSPQLPEWEVHIGMTGFVYVVGPGPIAMFRAYRSATIENLAIARRAVIVLNQTRREDVSAAEAEIRLVLAQVGWEEDWFDKMESLTEREGV